MKTSLKISMLLFSYFTSSIFPVFAEKMIAGEISYRNLSNLTYEFTVTIYQLSANLDSTIVVNAGSGNFTLTSSYNTSAGTFCGMNVSKSIYIFKNTYADTGIYDIHVYASTRIDSIINMTNSATTNLALKATLVIDSFIGINSAPAFDDTPIDVANLNILFINNNLAAYDNDGDSLSYQITTPLGIEGTPVAGYVIPPASNSFSIDSITGDIVWDSPYIAGYYSVAILLTEWRSGQIIGSYHREMLITICQPNTIAEYQNINSEIIIFPNPATETANVQYKIPTAIISFLKICSLNGEVLKIYLLECSKTNLEFSTTRLNPGLYLCTLVNAQGVTVEYRKLAVVR